MSNPNYKTASFLLGAADLKQLPADEGIEVAFVGRSNAGKSSVLNQLTRNKVLARVSKTPGRTQQINMFSLDANRRLVDLPGYGYAKVPIKVKNKWQSVLESYLRKRECLKGLILVMDIRHPLRDFDQSLLEWAASSQLTVHILLNKADKLTKGAAHNTLLAVVDALADYENECTVQIFSAEKGHGAIELRQLLDGWFSEE